jgi:hypothetical protein
MRHWALPLLLSVAAASCSPSDCTDLDCEHEAIVTFPAGLVDGPYNLTLQADNATQSARCNDPTAPETNDNPVGLRCDLAGFTLTDNDFANERTLLVSLQKVEGDEVVATDVEVRLEAVEELYPNGEDCDPVCFVRNGQLLLGN